MDILAQDRRHVWHPYTQMQTAAAPIPVVRGAGACLYLADGSTLVDAISSWWVTVHGHAEPRIAAAIAAQAQVLEQVIFAGFTHPQAVQLATQVSAVLGRGLERVFFSDDGSTAVEVALKMAWQYWHNRGEDRSRLLALEGAYHGDTFGAMSVSGRSVFTKAFDPLLFEVQHLPSPADDDGSACLQALAAALAAGDVAALIVEPLVQGAGGMRMYSPATLDRMSALCKAAGVPVIFDEVMTGFWRTGKAFAMHHCSIAPDIICLSKGLTGGFLPLALTVATEEIYAAFLSDDRSKMLFHGHSFTANALGCAAANASLSLFAEEETQARIARLCRAQADFAAVLRATGRVRAVRVCGTVLAFDLIPEAGGGYLDPAAMRIQKQLFEAGILIRPLGEVVYLMPPYCITSAELSQVHDSLLAVL
jgi:adenosylmethionine---8-amino-7-oxononanoate aminotransferase